MMWFGGFVGLLCCQDVEDSARSGIPVHVIQRGNNRHTLFTSDQDVTAYANWLTEGAINLIFACMVGYS